MRQYPLKKICHINFQKWGGGTVGQFWPLGCRINSTLTFVIFCIRVDVLQCQWWSGDEKWSKFNIYMCHVSKFSKQQGHHSLICWNIHLYLHISNIWICWSYILHFSNVCIYNRECAIFLLEHCCISLQSTSVFSEPNHPHLRTADIHICCILLLIFLVLPNTARNLTFVNGYFCIFLYFLLLLS